MFKFGRILSHTLPAIAIAVIVQKCALGPSESTSVAVRVTGKNLRIDFDRNLHSQVIALIDGKIQPAGPLAPSDYLLVGKVQLADFHYASDSSYTVNDEFGAGTRTDIRGYSGQLVKTVSITAYDDFPGVLLVENTYGNTGEEPFAIEGWVNSGYRLSAGEQREGVSFWSFQSGSYEDRHDWVLPLNKGFSQKNYLGMNATDYGGGIPVVDIWRPDFGLAVGHLEMTPKLVSLPVEMSTAHEAGLAVHYEKKAAIEPREVYTTYKTFVMVHQGDHFNALSTYRNLMARRGIVFDDPPETVFEPIWCAWGYERNFTMEQIYGTYPMVKDLGYEWVVLDDGWQTAEGDWYLEPNRFPGGDKDMTAFVDDIHNEGLKAKLWWAPLAVDPGTDLIKEHPDYLLLNENGSKRDISWWDAYYLCPASSEVLAYTRELVTKMIKTWGYDGFKMDGQHMNGVPPCYNPAHNHAYPEESIEGLPLYFKLIYDTVLELKPDAVVEFCPCGTAFNFHTLPYINQSVSSDPLSSWQIRLKGKTLKALTGNQVAYYGDHVELSDGGTDFATTVGIGGVIGTKFTWPMGVYVSEENGDISLTPERETEWRRWIKIYSDKMLPLGAYGGELYDIGFDKPETHVVSKDNRMYYAFYADSFDGEVQLRGLGNQTYRVYDYVNGQELGQITGPLGLLDVSFNDYLLVKVIPE